MKNKFFQAPNLERDKEDLADAKAKSNQQIDYSKMFYRPTPEHELDEGQDNMIRILPSVNSECGWHLRAAKHFVKHPDKTESFICMKETYGEECPACAKYDELRSAGRKEEANRYKPKRFGVFNVIDRLREEDGVKLYEAPIKAVWQRVVAIFTSNGKMSNLLDEYNEKGELVRNGRDIMIIFNPNTHPQDMYNVFPTDECPLSDDEEKIDEWIENMKDLIAEELYPPIEYEIAQIKTFGSKDERETLREKLRELYEAQRQAAEEGNKEDETDETYDRAQKARKSAGLKKKTKKEPKPEPEDEEEEEEVKEESKAKKTTKKKSSSDDVVDVIQAKVDALRKKKRG